MAKFEMDTDFVRKLAAILEETSLGEIELADGERRIRVARAAVAAPAQFTMAAPMVAPAGAPMAGPAVAAAPASGDLGKHPGAVKSPMVGTAYLSPEPGKPVFVTCRRQGHRRPDAAHHRGDEDLQSDQGPQGRRGHPGADRECAAGGVRRSPDDHRIDVRQDPDRQSGRDRAPHPSRLPRDGHPDRRGAFHGRQRRHARAPGRRVGLHRPAAGPRQLPQHRRHPVGRHHHRRRRDPSGLRLPVGERALRRGGRGARLHLHRTDRRAHPHDGRQDRRQADRARSRPAAGAGLARPGRARSRRSWRWARRSAGRC